MEDERESPRKALSMLEAKAMMYPVLCCSVLQRVAACYSVLQCVVVCCSVLQCVAVTCSSDLQW